MEKNLENEMKRQRTTTHNKEDDNKNDDDDDSDKAHSHKPLKRHIDQTPSFILFVPPEFSKNPFLLSTWPSAKFFVLS